MSSKTAKILSLTATLGVASNTVADLGVIAEGAFNKFFHGVGNIAYGAEQSTLDGRVDTTTYWTPEKLREVINDKKITFIYWKMEGALDEREGERFFQDVLSYYGQRIDRIVLINGWKYGREKYGALKDVLGEVNSKENWSSRGIPMYSIVGFGKEARVRGPPRDPSYEVDYKTTYKPGMEAALNWFERKKRESFLHSK